MDKFTHLGASVVDLEAAWQDRLKDAEVLLSAKRAGGAIADGIYALEKEGDAAVGPQYAEASELW